MLKAHLQNGAAAEAAVEADGFQVAADPESLHCSEFLDLRPYMDRAPPTVR